MPWATVPVPRQIIYVVILLAPNSSCLRRFYGSTSKIVLSPTAVDAKLFLWPDNDGSSLADARDDHGEEKRHTKGFGRERGHGWKRGIFSGRSDRPQSQRSGGIANRLRRFHGHVGAVDQEIQEHDQKSFFSLSKFSRLGSAWGNIMLQYIQNRLYGPGSTPFPKSDQSTSTFFLFQNHRVKQMLTEPRDAWEGVLSAFMALRHGYVGGMYSFVDSAYELGFGTMAACAALWHGLAKMLWKEDYQPDSPPSETALSSFSFSFMSELTKGLRRGASSAADGLLLFAAGVLVGTRNLVVGVARTPNALRSSRLGMLYFPQGKKQKLPDDGEGERVSWVSSPGVWDYYSLDYEDQQLLLEEQKLKLENPYDFQSMNSAKKSDTHNLRRRRRSSTVKDRKYYDILGVSTDADTAEIRSAYRREALRRHPDKQSTSPPLVRDTESQSSTDGFLVLTEAYRTLSSDMSRDAYDEFGMCFQEASQVRDDYILDSYSGTKDLLDELFGTTAVKSYIGDIQVAPIVNEIFGFSDVFSANHTDLTNDEIIQIKQRRRVIDIAKYIRDRVNSFVRGDIVRDQFIQTCHEEARLILEKGGAFSKELLKVISKTLLQESQRSLGYILPHLSKMTSDLNRLVSSKFAYARVYAPIYFRVTLKELVFHEQKGIQENNTDNCSNNGWSEKQKTDQDAVLRLLWQYVVNDSVLTLREACDKLFADRGVQDPDLAIAQTPMLGYQRAEAIQILAVEFIDVITQ